MLQVIGSTRKAQLWQNQRNLPLYRCRSGPKRGSTHALPVLGTNQSDGSQILKLGPSRIRRNLLVDRHAFNSLVTTTRWNESSNFGTFLSFILISGQRSWVRVAHRLHGLCLLQDRVPVAELESNSPAGQLLSSLRIDLHFGKFF